MGAMLPPWALAFLLCQEICVLHNPEQELIRDGRTQLALFVSLRWWDQISALDSEFSLGLSFPTALQSFWEYCSSKTSISPYGGWW